MERIRFKAARTWHRIKLRALSLMHRGKPRQLVFIIFTPRCGSNLLLDLLNSLPDTRLRGEVLRLHDEIGLTPTQRPETDRPRALRHIQRSIESIPSVRCGAKLGIPQLKKHGMTIDDVREKFPAARYLIIYRKSLFDQFVSREAARKTDQWYLKNAESKNSRQIRVDRDELAAFYHSLDASYRDLLSHTWLRDCSLLLSYEDLAANPQKQFDEIISPFLGLPPTKVKTSLVKQGSSPVEQRVKNFEEVKDLLSISESQVEYSFQ